jgi:hypothetical protein
MLSASHSTTSDERNLQASRHDERSMSLERIDRPAGETPRLAGLTELNETTLFNYSGFHSWNIEIFVSENDFKSRSVENRQA